MLTSVFKKRERDTHTHTHTHIYIGKFSFPSVSLSSMSVTERYREKESLCSVRKTICVAGVFVCVRVHTHERRANAAHMLPRRKMNEPVKKQKTKKSSLEYILSFSSSI